VLPNPLTAKSSFEILVRATEIALDRQSTLAAAMIAPEVLVRVDMGDIGLRDFHRLDDAVGAGRRAMEGALPALRAALESRPPPREPRARREFAPQVDPICDMVVDPRRAIALTDRHGRTIYFCSTGCRTLFARASVQEEQP
jgi:YHS domain-containing protein